MLALHHVLVSGARRTLLTPERATVAFVAFLTAAATPPVVASIDDAAREVGGSWAAMGTVMAITAWLSAAIALRALRAESELGARLWLVFGGAGAGAAAALTAGLVVAVGLRLHDLPDGLVLKSVVGGLPLGFVFGTVFGPVVLPAFRARRCPSHDGVDRVVFAGGATLLAFGLLRVALPRALPGAGLGLAAAILGALAIAGAGTRIVARIRMAARVRAGSEPGLHVVPRTGEEDEAPLLPLMRTAVPPAGVLAATGVSIAYRGARGVFKLALLPLPEQKATHPLAELMRAAVLEGGHALLTLALGATGVIVTAPIVLILMLTRDFG